ncbi:MAG: ABC transporter permease [Gaiellales bacterium]
MITASRAFTLRLAQALLVVWGVTLVAFVISRVLPGNPVYLVVGPYADPNTVAEATERLGLDHSVAEQYRVYMSDLLHGDLGRSITTSNPVTVDLGQRIPATVELALAAMAMTIVFAFPIGIIAAMKPGGIGGRLADVVSAGGVAIPQFWLGLMLIYFFFFRLSWFPPPLGRLPSDVAGESTGWVWVGSFFRGDFSVWWEATRALALPAFVLAFTAMPPLIQAIRTGLSAALSSDAVRTARALGLRSSTTMRDALRIASLPILEMLALIVGILISSAVLVETVFSWPGIGQYAVQAVNASDYAALQGVVLVSAVTYVVVYLVVEGVQLLLDPRLARPTR